MFTSLSCAVAGRANDRAHFLGKKLSHIKKLCAWSWCWQHSGLRSSFSDIQSVVGSFERLWFPSVGSSQANVDCGRERWRADVTQGTTKLRQVN